MAKIDLRKGLKTLYLPSAKSITEVQVPRFTYLMIDGKGDPNTSSAYAAAVEALFSVSYTAKFMVRKGPDKHDYAVMPLEGLWWADDLTAFQSGDRANWRWTMMIMQPRSSGSRISRKAVARRSCISGLSPPKARRSSACMTISRPIPGCAASITKST
jgi:hypothetical protein